MIENNSYRLKDEIIREEDLSGIVVDQNLIEEVTSSMTPSEILDLTEFPRPEAIHPLRYPSFSALLRERIRIRNLELLPVKSDEQYHFYHAQPKEELFRGVLTFLGESNLALAENQFPYCLPEDIEQYIVWLKDPTLEPSRVHQFITRVMQKYSLGIDDVILFERSLQTKSLLVKGSFPDFRHVHFWTRGNK